MLPVKIDPNPIFNSTVEIRFKTNKTLNDIFISLFSEFSKDLPKFKNTGFPEGLRESNVELKYFPDYVFSNDDYSISFNEHFISFENVSDYKLWENYSLFIKNSLERIEKLGLIDEIERIGVRYGSLFENVSDINIILNHIPKLDISNFKEEFIGYTTNIISDNVILILRIRKDFELNEDESINRKGHLIDIDAYIDEKFTKDQLFKDIENLHSNLKKLFFNLLKEDFIQSLNPQY